MNRDRIVDLWSSKSSLNEYPDFKQLIMLYSVYYFRCYVKIPSVPPNIDYGPCIELFKWITTKDIRLPIKVFHYNGKPVVVITWEGNQPELPSILLNSHMDVSSVYRGKWIHRPFDATWDEKGNIYGRGTQYAKCVGIQYLEAIRELRRSGINLNRTIHVSYVADAEVSSGKRGMREFSKSKEFKALNVGFALDVGMPNSDQVFCCCNNERCRWLTRIHCYGETDHSTTLSEKTAGEKIAYLLHKFYEYRQAELDKLKENPELTLGDVTSINLTMLKGGVETNIVPLELVMVVDHRIAPSVNLNEYELMIDEWCFEAGQGIWIEYVIKQKHADPTILDESNEFWVAFQEAVTILGITVKPKTNSCSTDLRHLRQKGIPAIGFSAVYDTQVLTHFHEEYINLKQYLIGIDIYTEIINSLGNTPYYCKCDPTEPPEPEVIEIIEEPEEISVKETDAEKIKRLLREKREEEKERQRKIETGLI